MSTPYFTKQMLSRPRPTGIDVEVTLQHFVIVTFRVPPAKLQAHLHPRFEPDCIEQDGVQWALISAVCFYDSDFRFVSFPWLKNNFGQTNYRAYVTDRETGEHVVWFFGTSLDTPFVYIPRHLWQFPWHKAAMHFDCDYDKAAGRYRHFAIRTSNSWADIALDVTDTGAAPLALGGFDELEAGLVLLTHPLRGFFYRRDGKIGSFSVWHDRLQLTVGTPLRADFALFDKLDLVKKGDLSAVHSVLMQPATDYTIYLPPTSTRP